MFAANQIVRRSISRPPTTSRVRRPAVKTSLFNPKSLARHVDDRGADRRRSEVDDQSGHGLRGHGDDPQHGPGVARQLPARRARVLELRLRLTRQEPKGTATSPSWSTACSTFTARRASFYFPSRDCILDQRRRELPKGTPIFVADPLSIPIRIGGLPSPWIRTSSPGSSRLAITC